MRDILIADTVLEKILELRMYLLDELKLSRETALKRTERMDDFLRGLGNAADYPLCRFRKWCLLGYRCAVFEKDWVKDSFCLRVIRRGHNRDMSHTAILNE